MRAVFQPLRNDLAGFAEKEKEFGFEQRDYEAMEIDHLARMQSHAKSYGPYDYAAVDVLSAAAFGMVLSSERANDIIDGMTYEHSGSKEYDVVTMRTVNDYHISRPVDLIRPEAIRMLRDQLKGGYSSKEYEPHERDYQLGEENQFGRLASREEYMGALVRLSKHVDLMKACEVFYDLDHEPKRKQEIVDLLRDVKKANESGTPASTLAVNRGRKFGDELAVKYYQEPQMIPENATAPSDISPPPSTVQT